jgi:hypothetical protein
VTSCAGANGFANMMLLGTPLDAQSPASLPLMKVRVDFSGVSGDIPAVDLVAPEIDIGDQRTIFPLGCIEQLHGIFAGRSYHDLKSPLGEGLFDYALNKMIVLNDKDYQ